MLTVVEKVVLLQNVDVFSEVPAEQLTYLASIAEEIDCLAGDVIFRENDPADALYLVLDGKVGLKRDGKEIKQAGSQTAFGTWALFDDETRVVTATVIENARLLKIDRGEFVDLLADNVQVTQGVLKMLVKRVRGIMDKLGTQPRDSAS
ncbi:MAG: cyclic nucleotide-binding domain-containing protein [candidate division Zixibacteria bacterium]|nr:cyclic nucleotide-binding domain-containing protein [candidate division Zixibacteria bacterium]